MFKRAAQIDIVHVPYRGVGQALTDLSSGAISITFSVLAPLMPHTKSGRIRILATMEEERNPALGQTPTVMEVLPGFRRLDGGIAFFGPPRLDARIVERLSSEIVTTVQSPEVRSALSDLGYRIVAGSPKDLESRLHAAREVVERAIEVAGIKRE